jgi:hypothetical protein
LLLLEVAAS